MEGSTVVIRPPDGDMAVYLDSLRRLQSFKKHQLRSIAPGHGHPIEDPQAVIAWYLEHRDEREQQILDALRDGVDTVDALVAVVYTDVDEERHPIARHSTFAHLRKLAEEGTVAGDDDIDGTWKPA
jgi:glyoxylase-like metal-dependent hydrolase (beta-lactamase superfamily II)